MSVSVTEGWFVNTRNQKLFTTLYRPPEGVPVKGVLARHHGVGDYSQRVREGNSLMASRGYAVWTFDVHGHGRSFPKSERDRFAVRQFSHLVDDFEQFLEQVVGAWCDQQPQKVPVFAVGGSLGGLVLMVVLARGVVQRIDGAIMSAPAAGLVLSPVMRVQKLAVGLLNRIVPRLKVQTAALDPRRLIVSEDEIKLAQEDQVLPQPPHMRVCTAQTLFKGISLLKKSLPAITCPVMFLHGKNDITTSAQISKDALHAVSSKDKTWVLFPDAKHDLELEPWKDAWHGFVIDWLDRQADKLATKKSHS